MIRKKIAKNWNLVSLQKIGIVKSLSEYRNEKKLIREKFARILKRVRLHKERFAKTWRFMNLDSILKK